ncbi:VOC family protein [Streptomyces sp. NPDC051211]|uniref:VOC family protein n=1 Tax=Streptomyces sp. NPDC051211 TaxID=3154643 RepID=UPI003450C87C
MTNAHPLNLVDVTVPREAHEDARRFYTEAFGWTVDLDLPGYPILGTGRGGSQVGLMWEGNPQSGDLSGFWKTGKTMPSLGTEDIEATLAEVERHGGEIAAPARQTGPVKVAVFRDPWGNEWFLCENAAGNTGNTGNTGENGATA